MKLRPILKNKKADVSEFIIWPVVIFFIAVSFLVSAYIINAFSTTIKKTTLNETDVGVESITKLDNIAQVVIQRAFLSVFAFLIIGTLLSSFLVRIHPAFLVIYIIFFAIGCFISIPLANTYQKLMENAEMAEVAGYQTMMNTIMEKILWVMIGVGAMSLIVVFGKMYGSGGYSTTPDIG